MIAVFRSELLKQRTTRTTLSLLLTMVALVVFGAVLHSFAVKTGVLATRDGQMKVFGWGELGGLFAGLLGAISITAEIRHGTVRPTFLVTPRRWRVIVAKLGVGILAGLAFGLIAAAVAIGVGSSALSARGISLQLGGHDYVQLLVGGAVGAGLWAAIGVGVGALVRNQVATTVGLFVWLFFIEALLLGQVPNVGRFLPGAAASALGGATITGQVRPPLLAPLIGLLIAVAYTGAIAVAGSVATVRRDVA
jgi:ABC-2 type transport system permease protein